MNQSTKCYWDRILSSFIKEKQHIETQIKDIQERYELFKNEDTETSTQIREQIKMCNISLSGIEEMDKELQALSDKKEELHNKICSIKYDELDQIDYLDIEYNKFALFKIPTKEYLEYKLECKINDFDERVRRFTYHKPIFKQSDGIGKNIERKIIHAADRVCSQTQYAVGEFGQTGKINGIGFCFHKDGFICEGNCIDGISTLQTKDVYGNLIYRRYCSKNDKYQGYFYEETDSHINEGYYHKGKFKADIRKKIKQDN